MYIQIFAGGKNHGDGQNADENEFQIGVIDHDGTSHGKQQHLQRRAGGVLAQHFQGFHAHHNGEQHLQKLRKALAQILAENQMQQLGEQAEHRDQKRHRKQAGQNQFQHMAGVVDKQVEKVQHLLAAGHLRLNIALDAFIRHKRPSLKIKDLPCW